MTYQEAEGRQEKTKKEKELMENIKLSRMKRRQLKEKSKGKEPEIEVINCAKILKVRLEETSKNQVQEEQQKFILKQAKIHRPGDSLKAIENKVEIPLVNSN